MAYQSYADWLKGITNTASTGYTLNKSYEDRKAALLAQIRANTQQGVLGQEKAIAEADNTYAPLRADAYTQNLLSQRRLRERMANMGMSATGGTSGTLENQNTMGLLNTLGGYAKQKQQGINDANYQIRLLQQQGLGSEAEATASLEAERQQALQDQYWKDVAVRQQEEQAKFDRAWALYLKKKITAKQFYTMTGIPVKAYKAKKKSTSSSGGDTINDFVDKLAGS